jgi:hypothetical protein
MSRDNGNVSLIQLNARSVSAVENVPTAVQLRVAPQVTTVAGTPAEAEVLRRWQESRGTFLDEVLDEYSDYDISTLQQLADTGDLKAMASLIKKYVSPEYVDKYGLVYSMPLMKLAAAYGSTDAFEQYATAYNALNGYDVAPAVKRATVLEVLAWQNAAALRGDILPNHLAGSDIKRENIELSEQDIAAIRQRSQQIYDEAQEQRRQLGLGDFDNSVPPEVKKFFGYLDNYMDQYP